MKKEKIIEYFSELIIVMIGVFLGMLISNWNNERKIERTREEVLINISRELESNRDQIARMSSSRKKFMKSYDSMSNVMESSRWEENFMDRPFLERLPNWNGIGIYNPEYSMFDAAKYSNVLIGMDIDLLQQLTSIYNKQEGLEELHHTMLRRFYDINVNTKYREVNLLIWQVRQELWGNQFLLMEQYDQLIDEILQSTGSVNSN